jgi:hypothetical protein
MEFGMADVLQSALALHTEAADGGAIPFALLLDLTVNDPELIRELISYSEGPERDRFALTALRIGLLALRQARGQIDADLVRSESDRLLADLNSKLSEHAQIVREGVSESLKHYFDPKDGRLAERIDRLVRKDGELESLLSRQIGNEDSQLTRTLSAHVGSDSPLMKVLSPDQSRGVLAAIREAVDCQLKTQREHVLAQFSLDNKDGALTRFIAELTDRQGILSSELGAKIDGAVHEFSLDDETSALSRLVGRVDEAHHKIARQFSLDDDASALARMKRELQSLITEHRQDNQRFQAEVKEALAAMAARRQEAERSTRHGLEFEDAVFELLQFELQRQGDIVTAVGQSTGIIKNCKVGDAVIELGPETAAPGARVVVEAKERDKYSLESAREEIEKARSNREASVGLFIFSKRIAPKGQEPLKRLGNDVFVIWDAEDSTSDPYFKAGVSLARALCIRDRVQQKECTVDLREIDAAIVEIEKQAGSLEEVAGCTESIQSNCEKILKRIRIARTAFEKQVDTLREKAEALRTILDGQD